MWVERLLASKVTNAIELSARFAEERQRILAQNVANVDTPDYHARRLDRDAFQRSLAEALGAARRTDGYKLNLRGNAQFTTGSDGPRVRPAVEPAANLLFHDGTNARAEELMSDAARNAMHYQFATTMLKGRFNGLLTAIRGRVG